MNSVFIGGSRKLSRLNDAIRGRLENIIEKNLRVLVGDANGTDKAIQKFFSHNNYENVVVYCMAGGCRNNIGSWETREISSNGQKRGWRYFALKDAAMAKDASCGFMIWDGRSKGTLNNVVNLLEDGKVSLLYFSPQNEFHTIRAPQDVRDILTKSSRNLVAELERQLNLESRLNSVQKALPLEPEAELQTATSVDT